MSTQVFLFFIPTFRQVIFKVTLTHHHHKYRLHCQSFLQIVISWSANCFACSASSGVSIFFGGTFPKWSTTQPMTAFDIRCFNGIRDFFLKAFVIPCIRSSTKRAFWSSVRFTRRVSNVGLIKSASSRINWYTSSWGSAKISLIILFTAASQRGGSSSAVMGTINIATDCN